MLTESPVTIVLADGWNLVREGLALLCDRLPGFRVVAQVETGQAALAEIERTRPHVALLDLDLSDIAVSEILRQVQQRKGRTRCAVLGTKKDGRTVLEALRSGAAGYLLKTDTAGQMEEAIRHIQSGGIYISSSVNVQDVFHGSNSAEPGGGPLSALGSREHQVFSLLVEGVRVKEIAARLSLNAKTVDSYRASLMRKLNIYDLAGLVRFAVARKLTSLPV